MGKRKKSFATKLKRLIARQGNRCHWCKRDIMGRKNMEPGDEAWLCKEEKTWYVLRWSKWPRHGHFVGPWMPHRILLANVDHVKPRSEGGDNKHRNLVASCMRCNAARNEANQIPFRKRDPADLPERKSEWLEFWHTPFDDVDREYYLDTAGGE